MHSVNKMFLYFINCLIYFKGETSAGKSTVLNLLLGEDFLPTHALSCTSVVTKIAYGAKMRAEIIYVDKRRPSVKLDNLSKEDLIEELNNVIYVKNPDDRERATEIKEVKLYVPSNILKVCQRLFLTKIFLS